VRIEARRRRNSRKNSRVSDGPKQKGGSPRQTLLTCLLIEGHRGHREGATTVRWTPSTVFLLRATSDEGRATVLSADSERATGHESRDTGDHPPITPITGRWGDKASPSRRQENNSTFQDAPPPAPLCLCGEPIRFHAASRRRRFTRPPAGVYRLGASSMILQMTSSEGKEADKLLSDKELRETA